MKNTRKILIVDNEEHLFQMLEREGREILFSKSGIEALDIIQKKPIDLVISNFRMPGMNSLEFIINIKESQPDIVQILLSNPTDIDSMIDAFNRGIVFHYLVKPCEEPLTRDIVEKGLKKRQLIEEQSTYTHLQLERVTIKTAFSLAESIEFRDPYTEDHCSRVCNYSLQMAQTSGLSEDMIHHLLFSSLFHDVGKIGISQDILLFQGHLSKEQRKIISTHSRWGFEITNRIDHLKTASLFIRHHHERWDGKGYPDKLKEDEIHICSRIISIADAYDAMTSDRPYRIGMEQEKARRILLENRGGQFDPELVDIFLDILNSKKGRKSDDESIRQHLPKGLSNNKKQRVSRYISRRLSNEKHDIMAGERNQKSLDILEKNEIISNFNISENKFGILE